MRKPHQVAALTVLLILTAGIAPSQEPSAPTLVVEPDPDLDELKRQNSRLEEQIKLLENERKLAEARFGSSDIEPLKGDVKAEGETPIETKFLAHEALESIATRIAKQIATAESSCPLIVHSETEFNSLYFYQAFLNQLHMIEKEYKRVLEIPEDQAELEAAPVAAAATGLLSSVADIASLFRTDMTVKATAFTLDELALVTLLADKLNNCNKVYHPAVILPNFLSVGPSALLTKLGDLDNLRNAADREDAQLRKKKAPIDKEIARLDLQIAEIEAKIKKAKSDEEKKKLAADKERLEAKKEPLKAKAAEIAKQVEKLRKVNELYLSISRTLVASSQDSGVSKMTRLLRAEKLFMAMNTKAADHGEIQPIAFTLFISILDAGGSAKITKNLFTGGKLRHSGGAVAAFLLFDPQGAIKKAGSFASHSGQKRFKSWNSPMVTPVEETKAQ